MRERMVHPVRCPNCFSDNPLARAVNGPAGGPKDGDVGLCATCGELLIFDSQVEGKARQPTPGEQRELDASKLIRRLRRAWREATT